MEAVADGASPDHRELRVDVHGPRSRHEEEAGLEVLEIVDRKRVQPLAVHRQHPLREEARVEREESGGVGQRCLDVAVRVADDEGVAVQDLHEPVAHRFLLAPAAWSAACESASRRGGAAGTPRAVGRRPRHPPPRAASPPSHSSRRLRCRSKSALSADDDGIGLRVPPRDGDVSLDDGDEPAIDLLPVSQVEPHRASRSSRAAARARGSPRASKNSAVASAITRPSRFRP